MDLEDLLASWDLSHLAPKCRELRFSKAALLLSAREDLASITPFVGEQVALWSYIQHHQESEFTIPGSSTTLFNGAQATSRSSGGFQSLAAQPGPSQQPLSPKAAASSQSLSVQPGPSQQPLSPKAATSWAQSSKRNGRPANCDYVAKKLCTMSNSKVIDKMNVRAVLLENVIGREIVQNYELMRDQGKLESATTQSTLYLSESQRDRIVYIIVNYILVNTENLHHSLLQDVAKKIVALFTSECEETYYIAPKSQGPHQTFPKGKLPIRVRNCKHLVSQDRLTLTQPQQNSKRSNNLATFLQQDITDEERGAQTWLQSGRSPWPEVIRRWILTAPIRFQALFGGSAVFINDYLTDWDILRHKSGYELLLEDFKLLYPGKEDLLYQKWSSFMERTIQLAKRDVKDVQGKETLKQLIELQEKPTALPGAGGRDVDKDSRVALLCAILPSIRASHRVMDGNTSRKVSVSMARNSFMLHVKVATDIKAKISESRAAFLGSGSEVDGGGLPLLVFVGHSLTAVKSVYISVADLLYKLDNLGGALAAIDVCFKCFHSLHMTYPIECAHIWMTIQRALYNLETEWDSVKDIRHSWIKAYKT